VPPFGGQFLQLARRFFHQHQFDLRMGGAEDGNDPRQKMGAGNREAADDQPPAAQFGDVLHLPAQLFHLVQDSRRFFRQTPPRRG